MEQTAESHSYANAVHCCGKLVYSTLSRKCILVSKSTEQVFVFYRIKLDTLMYERTGEKFLANAHRLQFCSEKESACFSVQCDLRFTVRSAFKTNLWVTLKCYSVWKQTVTWKMVIRSTIQSAEKQGKIVARKCILVSKSTEQVLSLALLPQLGKERPSQLQLHSFQQQITMHIIITEGWTYLCTVNLKETQTKKRHGLYWWQWHKDTHKFCGWYIYSLVFYNQNNVWKLRKHSSSTGIFCLAVCVTAIYYVRPHEVWTVLLKKKLVYQFFNNWKWFVLMPSWTECCSLSLTLQGAASGIQSEVRSKMLFDKVKGGHGRYMNASRKRKLCERRVMSKASKAKYYAKKF